MGAVDGTVVVGTSVGVSVGASVAATDGAAVGAVVVTHRLASDKSDTKPSRHTHPQPAIVCAAVDVYGSHSSESSSHGKSVGM